MFSGVVLENVHSAVCLAEPKGVHDDNSHSEIWVRYIPNAAPLSHCLSFVYQGIMPFRYDQLGKRSEQCRW